MFNLTDIVDNAVTRFFTNIFEQLITFFAEVLANIMGSSLNVLNMPLVENGIKYAQALAFTILVIKAMNEAFQTYILYQNGDPDSDPSGLLIRTAQAVAIISTLPWIITQIFTFGTKVALDVAGLGTGQTGISDWSIIISAMSTGIIIPLIGIALAICLLVVAIQASIRGAELALMSVIGPIMALNLTANNRSAWTSWFKQIVIICIAQALQIFMLQGALGILTRPSSSINESGMFLIFGWLWVTIKTPKFLQQFAYSTGFTGAVGGGTKQAGSMYLMRKMMAKG